MGKAKNTLDSGRSNAYVLPSKLQDKSSEILYPHINALNKGPHCHSLGSACAYIHTHLRRHSNRSLTGVRPSLSAQSSYAKNRPRNSAFLNHTKTITPAPLWHLRSVPLGRDRSYFNPGIMAVHLRMGAPNPTAIAQQWYQPVRPGILDSVQTSGLQ